MKITNGRHNLNIFNVGGYWVLSGYIGGTHRQGMFNRRTDAIREGNRILKAWGC